MATHLEITDGHSGLKIAFTVLAGQSCKLTAGTSPVTIRVLDAQNASADGLQLVKTK